MRLNQIEIALFMKVLCQKIAADDQLINFTCKTDAETFKNCTSALKKGVCFKVNHYYCLIIQRTQALNALTHLFLYIYVLYQKIAGTNDVSAEVKFGVYGGVKKNE